MAGQEFYGLKLVGDQDALVQDWVPTYNFEDMLLHESLFVAATSIQDGYEQLKDRYGSKEGDCRVWKTSYDKAVKVCQYPYINPGSSWSWNPNVKELTSQVIAHGKVVLGGNYSGDLYRRLTDTDAYHGSDLVCSYDEDAHVHVVRYDPDKAKSRRTRRATAAARNNRKHTAAQIIRERDQKEQDARKELDYAYAWVNCATTEAAKTSKGLFDCWGSEDVIRTRFGGSPPPEESYRYWYYDAPEGDTTYPFYLFWYVVDLRAKFVPKAARYAWRDSDAFGKACRSVWTLLHRFGTAIDRYKAAMTEPDTASVCRPAFDRFLVEVDRYRKSEAGRKAAAEKEKPKKRARKPAAV